MADLFAQEPVAPLPEALRPRTLEEVIGQSHLLGEGKPLRLAFQSGKPHSMIVSSLHCLRCSLVSKTSGLQWSKLNRI